MNEEIEKDTSNQNSPLTPLDQPVEQPMQPAKSLAPDVQEDMDLISQGMGSTNFPIDVRLNDKIKQYFPQGQIEGAGSRVPRTPGFFETLSHEFSEANDVFIGVRGLLNSTNMSDVLYDPVPEGWTPKIGIEEYTDINERYRGSLLRSTGPRDMARRADALRERQAADEYYSSGSLLASLAGGGLGLVFSPTTYIFAGLEAKIPLLSTVSLNTFERGMAHVATSSVAHEAWKETQEVGGNVGDFALNTFRDVVFGAALAGAGAGLGKLYRGGNYWDARRLTNHSFNGVELKPRLAETGKITGIKALAIEGSSASAKMILDAQSFANNQFAKKGLFGVPVMGKLMGEGAEKFNPVLRSLNSRFPALSAVMNRVAEHGFLTDGTEKGIARHSTFEGKMMMLTAENKNIANIANSLWYERNDIDLTKGVKQIKLLTKKLQDKKEFVSREKFNQEVTDAVVNQKNHPHGSVNELAAIVRKDLDEDWVKYLAAKGLPETIIPPRTAKGYMSRMFKNESVLQRPKDWDGMFYEWFEEANTVQQKHMRPIKQVRDLVDQAELAHEEMISSPRPSDLKLRQSREKISRLKNKQKNLEEKLQNALREDEDLHIHVDDTNAFSANESKELKKLLKPLKDLEKTHKEASANLARSVSQLAKAKGYLKRSKNKKTIEKNKVLISEIESDITRLEAIEDVHYKNNLAEKNNLQTLAENKSINPRFYYKGAKEDFYTYKDPSKRLKFGELPQTRRDMKLQARAYAEAILNQSPEDTTAQISGHLFGNGAELPVMRRTMMIPDKYLYENKFMHTDPIANLINYKLHLGRRRFIKESIADITIDGEWAELGKTLSKQRSAQQDLITNQEHILRDQIADLQKQKKDVTKLQAKLKKVIKNEAKELEKLEKDFKIAKNDLENIHNRMMGKLTGDKKFREFQRASLLLSVSTKLYGVPLTMFADLMGITYKHGLWKTISKGVWPMLKTFDGKLAGAESEAYRKIASHANLALNHVNSAYSHRYAAQDGMPYVPVSSRYMGGLEKMAHHSGNIYGTNYVENWLQRLTANVIQSHIIQSMIEHEAGTLGKRDLDKLLKMGLDPKIWAKKFVKNWKEAGAEGNDGVGRQSNYWKWKDLDAQAKFSESLTMSTRDTVIRKGMFDAPFKFDDPFLSHIFMFTGFLFSSITRYTLPLMQNPDIEKAIGTMLMLSAGAMIQPMRRIARGDEPFTDDDHLFQMAMEDSNVLSFAWPMIESLNIVMGGKLLSSQNEKYKDRSVMGVLGGPMGGIFDDVTSVLQHAIEGNLSQKDIDAALRNTPYGRPIYLQRIEKALKESTGLAETHKEAELR